MEALAFRITGFCIRNHLAEQEDEPWLRYGIEKRISTFINIIPFIILAVYLTNLPAALSFLFAFRALRKAPADTTQRPLWDVFVLRFCLKCCF